MCHGTENVPVVVGEMARGGENKRGVVREWIKRSSVFIAYTPVSSRSWRPPSGYFVVQADFIRHPSSPIRPDWLPITRSRNPLVLPQHLLYIVVCASDNICDLRKHASTLHSHVRIRGIMSTNRLQPVTKLWGIGCRWQQHIGLDTPG